MCPGRGAVLARGVALRQGHGSPGVGRVARADATAHVHAVRRAQCGRDRSRDRRRRLPGVPQCTVWSRRGGGAELRSGPRPSSALPGRLCGSAPAARWPERARAGRLHALSDRVGPRVEPRQGSSCRGRHRVCGTWMRPLRRRAPWWVSTAAPTSRWLSAFVIAFTAGFLIMSAFGTRTGCPLRWPSSPWASSMRIGDGPDRPRPMHRGRGWLGSSIATTVADLGVRPATARLPIRAGPGAGTHLRSCASGGSDCRWS